MIKSFINRFAAVAFLLLAGLATADAQFADQSTFAGTSGGTANAQTLSLSNVTSLDDVLGVKLSFIPGNTNTGAATLKIGALAAQPIRKSSSSGPIALVGSELVAGVSPQAVVVMWDGTKFLILSDVNSSPTAIFPAPQGYLTPCSASVAVTGCNVPNMLPTGDVIGAGTLYYRPGPNGNQIPIWNGSAMVTYQFPELPLVLGGSNAANTLYDVCVTTTLGGAYNVNGVPTAVTSVAWTNSNAGSGSRSTGGGTAQIVQTNGIWTNAVTIDGRNGVSTYSSIPANRCTIVATIFVDGTAGQVTFHRTFGTSRKWGAWNFYNRMPISLKSGWSSDYSVVGGQPTWRAANGNTANSLTVLSGLPEETYTFSKFLTSGTNSNNPSYSAGIGFNSTSTPSAVTGMYCAANSVTPLTNMCNASAGYTFLPSNPGINVAYDLEIATAGCCTQYLVGTEPYNSLVASWRG